MSHIHNVLIKYEAVTDKNHWLVCLAIFTYVKKEFISPRGGDFLPHHLQRCICMMQDKAGASLYVQWARTLIFPRPFAAAAPSPTPHNPQCLCTLIPCLCPSLLSLHLLDKSWKLECGSSHGNLMGSSKVRHRRESLGGWKARVWGRDSERGSKRAEMRWYERETFRYTMCWPLELLSALPRWWLCQTALSAWQHFMDVQMSL